MFKDQIVINNGKDIPQRSEIPFMILSCECEGSMIALKVDSRRSNTPSMNRPERMESGVVHKRV